VALAGAAVAEQHDRGAGVDERAGGQGGDGGRRDPGCHRGVEVLQPLEPGEVGLQQAAGLAALGALVDLGGQHLGQEATVGEAFAGGVVGDAGRFGGDGRQVQLAAGDPDGRLSGLLGHRFHAPTSPTSALATSRSDWPWPSPST
jgi:hypothetical protein